MKTALILVDIQNDYFPGGSMELVGMREAGSKARELLTFFRENQWPILHIQHIATREGATFFLPDTEGANIHEWVKPLPTETVIRKHHINSFRETRLLDELRRALIEKVVICGAMSHMCIDAATRAAADLGFACVVIHDACATRNVEFKGRIIPASDVHGSFMAALGSYADIVASDDFLSRMKKAGAP